MISSAKICISKSSDCNEWDGEINIHTNGFEFNNSISASNKKELEENIKISIIELIKYLNATKADNPEILIILKEWTN
jgi:hypothetical protein